ncbi:MAG TPA: nicotinate-nucleotide--dimethylbenzimidazole phosphoribosyltransferase [Actinomycetota bacterium]
MTVDAFVGDLLAGAPGPDLAARDAIAERAANVLRPAGALARLDEVAAWLGSWQRTATPRVERPAVVVFAADHGVAAEDVSAYPPEITAAMLRALREGVATATAMARAIGATVEVVDVGVGDPTGNVATEPAMSRERFRSSFEAGRAAARALETDLLVVGEMGIGNTTPAAAVAATLYGGPVEEWTGRGTGVDDATYERKLRVVDAARRRAGSPPPMETLRQVGGAELVAIAGALTEARLRSIPVVLDGLITTSPAAALGVLHAGALGHCVAGHRSPEPGHGLLLEKLGLEPLLDLGLRLGEGSGALAAVPLVRLAAAVVTDVATFAEWGL